MLITLAKMLLYFFSLVALFFLPTFALSNPPELTADMFEKFVKTEKQHTLVMFYAPWCGHCQQAKPNYIKAAIESRKIDSTKILALVNCDDAKNQALCNAQKIEGFPTYKYFNSTGIGVQVHQEFQNVEDYLNFMKDPSVAFTGEAEPPSDQKTEDTFMENVTYLTADNFTASIKTVDHCLVFYYAPWCPHCTQAKPEYNRAAAQLKDSKRKLFAVNCDAKINAHLCETEKVEGFPTLRYYKKGEVWADVEESITAENILKYLANPPKEKVPIQSYKDDQKGGDQEPPKDGEHQVKDEDRVEKPEDRMQVPYLTNENFTKATSEAAKHYFIMFYAPWCSHCATAKPLFVNAAKRMSKIDTNVILAAVNCDDKSSQSTCEAQKIEGFPTLVHYNNGKRVYDHTEAPPTEEGIFRYASSIKTKKDEL